MYKKLLLTIIAVMSLSVTLYAEAIFLRDGAIIKGTIIKDSTDSLTLLDSAGREREIPRANIKRILYTDLKLGKIYIQKRDGKNFVAFMVDEDRDSYTFRMDLYKPEEFAVKRADVLFIAEKNPSGLQVEGEIGTESVSLKWLPPYDEVRQYRVYIKKRERDKYEPAGSTPDKFITLRDLSSNTRYFIIVTSVDSDNYESNPSNELQVRTKNTPPDEPSRIQRTTRKNKVVLKWKESVDSDGKLKGYNLYRIGDSTEKIATVRKPEYTVPDDIPVYKVEITAFDDLDMESRRVRVMRPVQLAVSFAPSFMMAAGELGGFFEPGYGGLLNIGVRHYPFQDFETGINSGYIYFKGDKNENTETWSFVPLTAYAGYHFWYNNRLSVMPFIRAGESVSMVKYTGLEGEKEKTIIDPVAAAGLTVSMSTDSDRFTFSIGGDYGIIIESAEVRPYYEAFINCGVLFEL